MSRRRKKIEARKQVSGEMIIPEGNGKVSGEIIPFEVLFTPRPLVEGELPEVTSPSLRKLINQTALGQETPPSLRKELIANHTAEELDRAIREGIHRWYTYGERK